MLSPYDEQVIKVIERITNPRTGAYERVYPHHVAVYIPVERSIRQLRRDMSRLAMDGVLARIGQRGGYCLPVAVVR